MMRWVLLSLALALAAFGLLTVARSPDWLDWRLAVLAGQFGYFIAAVPVAIGVLIVIQINTGHAEHTCDHRRIK